MSPRKTNSNNPSDWLLFAKADLDALRWLVEGRVAFVVCRGKCAEALEKLVKAELILLGWPLVKTHDLQPLAGELKVRLFEQADENGIRARRARPAAGMVNSHEN